jgi:hypothetical protein
LETAYPIDKGIFIFLAYPIDKEIFLLLAYPIYKGIFNFLAYPIDKLSNLKYPGFSSLCKKCLQKLLHA